MDFLKNVSFVSKLSLAVFSFSFIFSPRINTSRESVPNRFHMGNLGVLPDDVICKIGVELDARSLARLSRTCRWLPGLTRETFEEKAKPEIHRRLCEINQKLRRDADFLLEGIDDGSCLVPFHFIVNCAIDPYKLRVMVPDNKLIGGLKFGLGVVSMVLSSASGGGAGGINLRDRHCDDLLNVRLALNFLLSSGYDINKIYKCMDSSVASFVPLTPLEYAIRLKKFFLIPLFTGQGAYFPVDGRFRFLEFEEGRRNGCGRQDGCFRCLFSEIVYVQDYLKREGRNCRLYFPLFTKTETDASGSCRYEPVVADFNDVDWGNVGSHCKVFYDCVIYSCVVKSLMNIAGLEDVGAAALVLRCLRRWVGDILSLYPSHVEGKEEMLALLINHVADIIVSQKHSNFGGFLIDCLYQLPDAGNPLVQMIIFKISNALSQKYVLKKEKEAGAIAIVQACCKGREACINLQHIKEGLA